MRYRLLGRSKLRVSELCLGIMNLDADSSSFQSESLKIYEAYRGAGGNFIEVDSSCEQNLRDIIASDRESVVLATKTSYALTKSLNLNLVQSVEASLKRLDTDYIDLLWLQGWKYDIPMETIMRGLHELVLMGKVLTIGISEAPAWIISRCNLLAELQNWTPFHATQIEYGLSHRLSTQEILPMARELNITPLSRFSGEITTNSYHQIDYLRSNLNGKLLAEMDGSRKIHNHHQAIAHEVNQIAQEIGCSPNHVSLNWLRQQEIIPILDFSNLSSIEDCLNCVNYSLSSAHMNRLHNASQTEFGLSPDLSQHYSANYLVSYHAEPQTTVSSPMHLY